MDYTEYKKAIRQEQEEQKATVNALVAKYKARLDEKKTEEIKELANNRKKWLEVIGKETGDKVLGEMASTPQVSEDSVLCAWEAAVLHNDIRVWREAMLEKYAQGDPAPEEEIFSLFLDDPLRKAMDEKGLGFIPF